MAKELNITFQNDQKFDRDIELIADAWGYADAFLINSNLTKQKFIEKKIKDDLQTLSKSLRLQQAKDLITVED
jgi:hypothetical protein